MLPLHELLGGRTHIQIIVDNARKPVHSATDDYYQTLMESRRRRKPRFRRRHPIVLRRDHQSLRDTLQKNIQEQSVLYDLPPTPIRRKGSLRCRWETGALPSLSTAIAPVPPQRRPRLPVRTPSSDGYISGTLSSIGELQLYDNSDTETEESSRSTGSLEAIDKAVSFPIRRTSSSNNNTKSSTSALISQVIDELKLYDKDSCCDEENDDDSTIYDDAFTSPKHSDDDDLSCDSDDAGKLQTRSYGSRRAAHSRMSL
jgi:hypothetical protein